ncbi:MAG TPA: putative manganese-dependent inorganic diphosphatase [Methanoregulaceae archaeon]|nr:putative manganese-dependent inorganic diphosphatase [Methanoregulaceae archaeon]
MAGLNSVYVIGHRQPDTDSICSVIGYAELLNMDEPGVYIPARCGECNAETQWALAEFGTEPPIYIESVEPGIADIPYIDTRSARTDVPTVDVAALMDQYDMRNIPIVDASGRLAGLVSEYGLARAYVTGQREEPLAVPPIRLEDLARILYATVLVGAHDHLEGRVYTAIDALHVTLSRLTAHDVAIVGDNEPAQLTLISAGIAAMIVADGAPVGDRVLNAARAQGVTILATDLDAFSVGKRLHLSAPAGMIMETDVPTVTLEDTLERAKHLVSTSKFRTACVVDEEGRFLGLLSRTSLMQDVQKAVILLDHNEPGQAVDGIENADILEIIDHHRLGVISTLKPIRFLNDPVGSTCTIITTRFMEAGRDPSPATAGLLLCGILSDTLVLRMSTTTSLDHRAVEYLAGLIDRDPVALGTTLIEKGMSVDELPIGEQLRRDSKSYELFGRSVVISQVMVPSFAFPEEHGGEIRRELGLYRASQRADLAVVLYTSVFENASLAFFAANDEAWLGRLNLDGEPLLLRDVMSRKKDFVPRLGQLLRQQS